MSEPTTSLPSASIVVPTFNRLGDLQRVVRSVRDQVRGLSMQGEIVVVDDGSTDGTAAWLDATAAELGATVLHQDNAGPATARNRGVAAANGEIVLFLGDDTVPQPGWLLEHLDAQRIHGAAGPVAVLGYTAFPPEADSPFLRWINEFGAQFGYALVEDPTRVPFNFFYTSNVSLPRRFFAELGGFREDFPAAAWEDIEFAYRAVDRGLRLRYVPRARTIHHHRVRVSSFCARQRTSGHSAAIFSGLHPELAAFLGVPCVGRAVARSRIERCFLQTWIALGERIRGLVDDRVYRRFIDSCYLEGLAEGLRLPAEPAGK